MEQDQLVERPRKRPRRLKTSMTIYLRPQQHAALHELAEREGESIALLVRRGVDRILEEAQ